MTVRTRLVLILKLLLSLAASVFATCLTFLILVGTFYMETTFLHLVPFFIPLVAIIILYYYRLFSNQAQLAERPLRLLIIYLGLLLAAPPAAAFGSLALSEGSMSAAIAITIYCAFLWLVSALFISQGYFALADIADGIESLRIRCPECGRTLKGATTAMIGDTGVCRKCKAEFTIQRPHPDS